MGRVSDAKDRLLEAAIKLVWRNSFGCVSVDDICQEAGVKKGSFYHFFPGKNELVAAAFRQAWATVRPDYDRMFSPTVPPIDRLRAFLGFIRDRQEQMRQESGRVLGCPFASIGTELIAPGENDGGLRDAIQELVRGKMRYIESAIRDAMSEGSIQQSNATALAETVYLYIEGALSQARIQNDLKLLDRLEENALRLIGFQPATV